MACHCASSSGEHRVFGCVVCWYACAARTCVHARITWTWHVAAQESQQHEGRRIAQATLPCAPRFSKTTTLPQRALQCALSSLKRLKRTLARQPVASSERLAIEQKTFIDKYGGQPHHKSKIGAQAHGFSRKEP